MRPTARQAFDQCLHDHVASPLGAEDTASVTAAGDRPGLVAGHIATCDLALPLSTSGRTHGGFEEGALLRDADDPFEGWDLRLTAGGALFAAEEVEIVLVAANGVGVSGRSTGRVHSGGIDGGAIQRLRVPFQLGRPVGGVSRKPCRCCRSARWRAQGSAGAFSS